MIFGLLPALRASNPDRGRRSRTPCGSVAGTGESLFLAQRTRRCSGRPELPPAVWRGTVRAQFAEPADHRYRRPDGQSRHVPSVARAQRLRRSAHGQLSMASCSSALRSSPGDQVGGLCRGARFCAGDEWDSTTSVEGHDAKDGEDMQAFMNALSAGYFETMGIRFLEGRDFNRMDVERKPESRDRESQVRGAFFPRQERDRQAARPRLRPPDQVDVEIVGVVEDSLYEGPREGVRRQVFWPGWGVVASRSTCARRRRPRARSA